MLPYLVIVTGHVTRGGLHAFSFVTDNIRHHTVVMCCFAASISVAKRWTLCTGNSYLHACLIFVRLRTLHASVVITEPTRVMINYRVSGCLSV